MAAKPIIQGQEFPVITPTAIKDMDEIPVEVDVKRVNVVCPSVPADI
jgi:DNA-directed RNA polymerase I and III subunit RPAC2